MIIGIANNDSTCQDHRQQYAMTSDRDETMHGNGADPTPSEADIKVTRDLIRAGQLLKIEVLDHLVIGDHPLPDVRQWASLRELGYFYS